MREILRRYPHIWVASLIILLGAISNWNNLPSWGVIVSILVFFFQIIMLEFELIQVKSGHPKLIYKTYWVENKVITTPKQPSYIYNLLDDFHPYDGKTYPTSDVLPAEYTKSNDLLDNNVVGIWIANEPENRNKYSVAEDVVARITFFTSKGNIEVDGRWWVRDTPLYPPRGTNFDNLRKTIIEPGDPKRLVIAYKVKDGNLFYPFGYDTFNEMSKQRQDNNLGKGSIKFQVVLEGVNLKPTPPMNFLLDGSYDDITIKRM